MVKSTKKSTVKDNILTRGKCDCGCKSCGETCIFYFLGFLGATIYYISTATSFWMGVLGVLKALVWPVFVVMTILGLQ